MIQFDEAAEKLGSDTIRYLFAQASTVNNVRFGYRLGDEIRRKLLGFINIYVFFKTYAEIDCPKITAEITDNVMDAWLVARTDDYTEKAGACYERYNLPELMREFESCADDISNWYVRTCRRRFWKETADSDKASAYNALYYALTAITRVMAPVLPFLAEYIWQDMARKYGEPEESVHLSAFPAVVISEANAAILEDVKKTRTVIAQALNLRNKANIKVRQPLSFMYADTAYEKICAPYIEIIRDELNIKKIVFADDSAMSALNGHGIIKSDAEDGIFVAIDTEITGALRREGIYRDILRHCQVLRKEAGFDISDRILLSFETESELLKSVVEEYKNMTSHETLSDIIEIENPIKTKEITADGHALTIKCGK